MFAGVGSWSGVGVSVVRDVDSDVEGGGVGAGSAEPAGSSCADPGPRGTAASAPAGCEGGWAAASSSASGGVKAADAPADHAGGGVADSVVAAAAALSATYGFGAAGVTGAGRGAFGAPGACNCEGPDADTASGDGDPGVAGAAGGEGLSVDPDAAGRPDHTSTSTGTEADAGSSAAIDGDVAGVVAGLVAGLDRLRGLVGTADGLAAVGVVQELDVVAAVLEGVRLAAVRRVEVSGVWQEAPNQTANSFLRAATCRDHGEVSRDLRAAGLLADFEVVRAGVESGRVSRGHVDVLVAFGLKTPARAQALPAFLPSLVNYAGLSTVGQFRRVMATWAAAVDPVDTKGTDDDAHRRRFLNVSKLGDGLRLDGFLAPEAGAKVCAALNGVLAQLYRDREAAADGDKVMVSSPAERADALEVIMDAMIAEGGLPESGSAPAAVSLVVPLNRLEDPCCEGADPGQLLEDFTRNLAEQYDLVKNTTGRHRNPRPDADPDGNAEADANANADGNPYGGHNDVSTDCGHSDPSRRTGSCDRAREACDGHGHDNDGSGARNGRGHAASNAHGDDDSSDDFSVDGFGGGDPRGDRDVRGKIRPDRLFPNLAPRLGPSNGPGDWLISPATARQVTCDCVIRRIVVDTASKILDVGRNRRIFPDYMRKALEVRDGGCVFPFCDRPPSWSHAHHIKHWADGGTTSLDNAALLCSRHHHVVHSQDYRVFIGPDGRATVDTTPPDQQTNRQ